MTPSSRPTGDRPLSAPGVAGSAAADGPPALGGEPDDLASAARTVLSCPSDIELQVDGVSVAVGDGTDVTLQATDSHGTPIFSCHPSASLVAAADLGHSALMTLGSGLGLEGGQDRNAGLVLAGRLVVLGTDTCDCCLESRHLVGLQVAMVLLTRHDPAGARHELRVPLPSYGSSAHQLNRGYLQRAIEHVNDGHQDELRRAVSMSSGTRLGDVLGVRLGGLSPRGVEVSWVDPSGAHRLLVDFGSPARTPAELASMLSRHLHTGLC